MRRGRHPFFRRFLEVLAVAMVLVLVAVGLTYHRQIYRYVTHLKGGPTSTVAWEPFPVGERPERHLAVVGDIGDSGARLQATADAVAEMDRRLRFDALLVLGDNVYPSGDPARLRDTLFH